MKVNEYTKRQVMQNEGYEIFYYKTFHHCNVELHHHDFYEIYYFISGSVAYNIELDTYILNPDDIVLISPGQLHKPVFLREAQKYERIVLWISKKMMESLSTANTDLELCFRLATQTKRNRIPKRQDLTKQVRDCLEGLLTSSSEQYGNDVLVEVYIKYILIHLARYLDTSKLASNADSKKTPLMDNSLQYINNNLAGDLRLQSIADHLNISKFYLAHEFKRQHGINIGRYITLKRLSLAKELLLSGKTVQDIATICGYNNISNFFRLFKLEFGMTPKEYYKMMK